MKGFLEKLKDFIYDSIDYFIMLAIVIGVVFIIGWRLDVLFAKDTSDIPTPPIVTDQRDVDKDDKDVADQDDDLPPEDNEDPSNDSDDPDNSDDPDMDNPDTDNPESTSQTVTVTIPDGTLPSGIGAILESNGLVSNKNDFVIKAQSMELDRKLRSGTFEILNNSSLEEIVKIIAKQN